MRDIDAMLYDLILLAIVTVLAIVLIAAVIALAPAIHAAQAAPICVPIIVTRGNIRYLGTHGGLIVSMTSADNLDGDGIFRNGFEQITA